MMTRRAFAKMSLLGSLAASATGFGGCSLSSVEAKIKAWIPVALTSVAAIVKLLGPLIPAPVAGIIAIIQAGFSSLLTAVTNYQAGTGVLSDISNAMTAIENAFQNFFASLNVPTALLGTIEGLGGILLSTLQAFAAEIAPATPPTSSFRMAGRVVAFTAKKRNVGQYRNDWNAEAVKEGHPEARI